MEIKQFDLLVHPDFSGMFMNDDRDIRETAMGTLWDQRISELSKQEDAVLLYYSAYPKGLGNTSAFPWETERKRRYQSELGDRFISFDVMQIPKRAALLLEFRQRGFHFNRETARLTAYGQYYDSCVKTWLNYTKKALELPEDRCSREPSLSIGVFLEFEGLFPLTKD